MKGKVTIRYVGKDLSRRFLIERKDGRFWTGKRWTLDMSKARLYARLRDAQVVCTGMQLREQRGKPQRRFHCTIALTVFGDQPYTIADLRDYLAEALHLNFDNAAADDGPCDSFVLVRALLSSLVEITGDVGEQFGDCQARRS